MVHMHSIAGDYQATLCQLCGITSLSSTQFNSTQYYTLLGELRKPVCAMSRVVVEPQGTENIEADPAAAVSLKHPSSNSIINTIDHILVLIRPPQFTAIMPHSKPFL
jgi:hypothetical protein